ncbi:liver-expressed antimicrobial peptide 2 [Polymixia lowei]
MQERGFFTQRKAAAMLCVLLMLSAQVGAGPVPYQEQGQPGSDQSAGPVAYQEQGQPGSDQSASSLGEQTLHTLRRVARMSPLWRILNSKPFGAYCQNHYECSSGICRGGHCSTGHRSFSEPVNY